MTRRIYPPPATEKPLATRIHVPITHVIITPQGRRIEVNATPEFIEIYKQRTGCTVEVK